MDKMNKKEYQKYAERKVPKPVSYTHLDVYKRQMHWFPKHGKTMDTFRVDVKKLLNEEDKSAEPAKKKYYRVQIGAYTVKANAEDVYKRQPLACSPTRGTYCKISIHPVPWLPMKGSPAFLPYTTITGYASYWARSMRTPCTHSVVCGATCTSCLLYTSRCV